MLLGALAIVSSSFFMEMNPLLFIDGAKAGGGGADGGPPQGLVPLL